MNKDDLGNRMKTNYEQIPKTKLMRRCPVIVRLDMRCGHSYCKGFERPFDETFIKSMQETAKYLAENTQGVKMTYQQSDEISLLLVDYETLNSQAFFDYEVQKVCSITASMATMAFNKAFLKEVNEYLLNCAKGKNKDIRFADVYSRAVLKGAMFDSRCFNIPESEVANYFYWRQLDATRNSIQMVGQANFSHKELQNKSCNMIQEMLHEQKNINWNDYPTHKKRGSCCIKVTDLVNDTYRTKWIIDNDIPIFINNGRNYIEKLIGENYDSRTL